MQEERQFGAVAVELDQPPLQNVASEGYEPSSGWRRTLAAAICSLGGLTFGYDLGALSSATQGLSHSYALSPALFGLTVSASLWGALSASLLAGRLADRLGRKGLLAGCAFFYALAACVLALPVSWPWGLVLALRLVTGMSIGGFVIVCPLYLAEIAPRVRRGRFVGWFQLQIGAGVTLAFATSAILARYLQESMEWKWCFGLGALAPVCILAFLHWVPEEPHWFAGQDRWSEACDAARRLSFTADEWPAPDSFKRTSLPSPSSPEKLFRRKYLRPLLLATSLAAFNQLCGGTILRVYLLELLWNTGMGRLPGHTYGILISLLNLAALLIGVHFVDRVGRRPLLIAGSAGMAACLFSLTYALHHRAAAPFYLLVLVAYNTCFALSQGAVTWPYLSEIFPFSVRGKGQGYGAFIHWITNAGLIWMFPILEHAAPQSSFLLFGSMMILQIPIVFFGYPETRGTQLGSVVG